MKKAKIYTKVGDHGETRLVGGTTVRKSDPRVDAYGTLDELNSQLGLCIFHCPKDNPALLEFLEQIQNELFNIGSLLACEDETLFSQMPQVEPQRIEALEQKIDQLSSELPELRNFILPGGGLLACHFHLARCICRRAERLCSDLLAQNKKLNIAFIYLNRLSDFLFVIARWSNHKIGVKDIAWKKS